jgi:hypothetical protein
MAKRGKRRARKQPVATVDYTDPEGNVLTLRQELTVGTVRKLERTTGRAGASGEDIQRRREEMLFERLVVSWVVAGLPLSDQKMLLGRYRMADTAERDWVRRTIATHLGRFMPELAP